ncbi:hypothetical protein ANCCAN_30430 [Ancylostoma caninum]|uniref:Uncharacterized protein n=1 Tax=Ancylostoma caninum TaxID=29170 RepID=A0A368EW23_ANCCA|nr:hypothetical protein ANCCAN_30430 [Ancylostoma caninum]
MLAFRLKHYLLRIHRNDEEMRTDEPRGNCWWCCQRPRFQDSEKRSPLHDPQRHHKLKASLGQWRIQRSSRLFDAYQACS